MTELSIEPDEITQVPDRYGLATISSNSENCRHEHKNENLLAVRQPDTPKGPLLDLLRSIHTLKTAAS